MYHLIFKSTMERLLLPTLAYHNHDKFEIFAFAELKKKIRFHKNINPMWITGYG